MKVSEGSLCNLKQSLTHMGFKWERGLPADEYYRLVRSHQRYYEPRYNPVVVVVKRGYLRYLMLDAVKELSRILLLPSFWSIGGYKARTSSGN